MSQKLKKSKSFLTLLLDTESAQARALLYTITQPQVEAIVEIVYNLMNIASATRDKTVLKKRKVFLKKLVNKKTNFNQKRRLVVKHRVKLLKTLLHFKKTLLNVLK